MKYDKSIKVIYIAGNGHSGSTLLDIILGSSDGYFSAGELTNITRSTILNEYCSCGEKIETCQTWSKIMSIWDSNREISFDEYKKLRWQFERNKTVFTTLINQYAPSVSFIKYCNATLEILRAIKQVTGCSVIIDSSKLPSRIAVLNKIVDLQVIHLCRNFTGVLNSGKRSSKKDIKAGIEKDLPSSSTTAVFKGWLVNNLNAELFGFGKNTQKIKYAYYIQNMEYLKKINPNLNGITGKSYNAEHMLAGNYLRLKNDVKVDSNIGFRYKLLSSRQRRIGKTVDTIFSFWS